MLQKAPKNNCKKKNVVSKRYLSLQRFNPETREKKNTKVIFDTTLNFKNYLFKSIN